RRCQRAHHLGERVGDDAVTLAIPVAVERMAARTARRLEVGAERREEVDGWDALAREERGQAPVRVVEVPAARPRRRERGLVGREARVVLEARGPDGYGEAHPARAHASREMYQEVLGRRPGLGPGPRLGRAVDATELRDAGHERRVERP